MNRRIFLKYCFGSLLLVHSLKSSRAQAAPKRIAVVIGIDNYANFQKLSCAGQDALELATILRKHIQYDVTTLVASGQVGIVTKQDVIKALKDAVAAAQENDTLLFAFSGHGSLRGQEQYLLLSDTDPNRFDETALSFDEMAEILRTCRTTNRIFIVDACRKTSVDIAHPGQPGFKGGLLPRQFTLKLDQVVRASPPGVQVKSGILFSCAANQSAIEPASGNSYFTAAILSALGGGLKGDNVKLAELLKYVLDNLPNEVKNIQTPEVVGDRDLTLGSVPAPLLMYFERSAAHWLQQAVNEFMQQNPAAGRIMLEFHGSREGKDVILYRQNQPVIWIPADVYWPEKLDRDWQDPAVGKHNGSVIANNKSILQTALVLVMHTDRARIFKAAMQRPQYRSKTWTLLHDLALYGWSHIGGPRDWGRLKLAQSDPIRSNSGMVALSLMFAEYRNQHNPTATTDSPGFVKWMSEIESSVQEFVETTSITLDDLQDRQKNRDVAICYEQNAFSALKKGAVDLQVIYPAPTVFVEFPAVTLAAPWVSPQQARVGKDLTDYLLLSDTQRQAIDDGFRPVYPELRSNLDDKWARQPYSTAGFNIDPLPIVTRPAQSRDIDDLLYQWDKRFGQRKP